MLKIGEKKYRINFNDDYIPNDYLGNVGDNETRSICITIIDENNVVVNDEDLKIELVCKPLNSDEVFKKVAEKIDQNYFVKYPNSIFTKNQTVQVQIIAKKENQQISTPIFEREIKKSILGEVTEDRDIFLDLSKVHNLAMEYERRLEEMEDLKLETKSYSDKAKLSKDSAEGSKYDCLKIKSLIEQDLTQAGRLVQEVDEKKNIAMTDISEHVKSEKTNFSNQLETMTNEKKQEITNHTNDKIVEFNQNAIDKTNDYNENHEAKKRNYNENHETKKSDYNENAENKIDELNKQKADITKIHGNIAAIKLDFELKYNSLKNIINSENERVEAEKNRAKHDEKIQNLLNQGLNAELGEYAKKTELEAESKDIKDYAKRYAGSEVHNAVIRLKDYIKDAAKYFEREREKIKNELQEKINSKIIILTDNEYIDLLTNGQYNDNQIYFIVEDPNGGRDGGRDGGL